MINCGKKRYKAKYFEHYKALSQISKYTKICKEIKDSKTKKNIGLNYLDNSINKTQKKIEKAKIIRNNSFERFLIHKTILLHKREIRDISVLINIESNLEKIRKGQIFVFRLL